MGVPCLSLPEITEITGIDIIKQYSVKETYPVHTHDFGELFFVSSGKGMHCINGNNQLLEKGSLVFIRPDDEHSFSAINYFDFVMYSLGFPMSEFERAMEYLGMSYFPGEMPPHIVLRGSVAENFEQKLEQLMMIRTEKRLSRFRSIFPEIIFKLIDAVKKDYSSVKIIPIWLVDLVEIMGKKENYVLGLSRMLELCPYSQEYLNRMFRKHFKSTPTEYINARRMVYAAELLVDGKYNVTEICYMTGFNNLSYFYNVFNKQYACTPKEFVKRQK